MKVLMTAIRPDYAESVELLKGSDSSRWTIRNAMLEAGWEVDLRLTQCGEDLDGYDLIICEANDPRGPKTQGFYGWMWALMQDWNGGPPVVMNWDHWEITRIWHGMLAAKDPMIPLGPWVDRERAKPYVRHMEEQVERFTDGRFPSCITCAWNWGDHSKITKRTNLKFSLIFDPSADQPLPRVDTESPKRRQWVLGARTNHQKWVDSLGLKWPVKYYWAVGGPKVKRDELLMVYSMSWGVMSPKYYHVGSGYWRARIVHAAHTGSIALCHPDEVPHPTYSNVGISPGTVEELTDAELRTLSEAQAEWLTGTYEPRINVIGQLQDFLKTTAMMQRNGEPLPVTGQESLF